MKTTIRSILCLGATALLFGCTAGTKATGMPGTGGSGTGTAGTTGSGGTTGTGGSLSFDGGHDITVGDTSSDGVCATTTTAAEPVPLDLYVTVDLSKSMNLLLPNSSTMTKWDAVKSALNTFFASPQSMGIGAGLGFFPLVQSVPATCTTDTPCATYGPCDRRKTCVSTNSSTTVPVPLCIDNTSCTTGQNCDLIQQCSDGSYCAVDGTGTCSAAGCTPYAGYCHARDVCDATQYATPVVPIAALSGSATGQAATLMTSLGQHSPDGYTPTGPALKGAIQYAQTYAGAHAGHKLAIVLVTDGLPLSFTDYFDTATGIIHYGFPRTECNPSDIPGIAAVAAGAASGTPAIPTFVIGVYSSAEGASIKGMLDQIATGGGTTSAVLIDTSSTQDVATALQTKLADIRTKSIACDFQIPTTGVSFDKVNVTFTSGGTDVPIGHAGAADGKMGTGCDSRGGWYYDTDYKNDAGTPSKITVCPATCQMLQSDLSGKVNVVLGCPTIDVG